MNPFDDVEAVPDPLSEYPTDYYWLGSHLVYVCRPPAEAALAAEAVPGSAVVYWFQVGSADPGRPLTRVLAGLGDGASLTPVLRPEGARSRRQSEREAWKRLNALASQVQAIAEELQELGTQYSTRDSGVTWDGDQAARITAIYRSVGQTFSRLSGKLRGSLDFGDGRCPHCGSPDPKLHAAGGVDPCPDPWHRSDHRGADHA